MSTRTADVANGLSKNDGLSQAGHPQGLPEFRDGVSSVVNLATAVAYAMAATAPVTRGISGIYCRPDLIDSGGDAEGDEGIDIYPPLHLNIANMEMWLVPCFEERC